jgi:diguanylate cyclase (GGDEF)-like protein/PAS domain S-box-containing protein
VDVNRAAELAYGYTRDELMAMNVAELRHPDYVAPLRAQLDKALEGGNRFETRHVRKDGTWFDVEIDSQPADIGGERLLVGVCRDITVRKRVEEELRESEERYRSILNASPDDITITDLEGRILVVSPAALTMFGCDREDGLLGHLLTDFIAPEDRDRAASNIALVLQGTTPGPTEYRGLRADGSTFDIEVNAEPVRDAEGQPTSIVFVVRDTTERKHAEKGRFEDLEEVANADRLTGLHNRRGFDLVAEQAIAQAQRTNLGIGLIFCDMDGVKTINDEFGHAQGDRALQDAASILQFTLRSADAIARVGGDEFIVLAVGAESEAVLHLNERLQKEFELFNATNERPYRLSMSSGTAWCEPGTPCRLEELRAAADSNMYADKVRRRRAR